MTKFFRNFYPLLLAYMLWVLCMREFFLGEPQFNEHGTTIFDISQFFFNHIFRGVLPMWDPYNAWGRPDGSNFRFIGEFNPFLWIIPFFNLVMGIAHAYVIYILVYYFMGLVAFYLMAQRIFKDKTLALAACLFLLFSCFSISIINDPIVILLFVPAAWFFYFLQSFAESPQKSSLLGTTFCLMVIMTTYLPFYFLTVFFVWFVFYLLLFPREVKDFIVKTCAFLWKNKIFTIFCLSAFIVSVIPGWLWYKSANSGEEVLSYRQTDWGSHNMAGVMIETINVGGIVGRFTPPDLLFGLSNAKIGLFFMPGFFYLLILLSLRNNHNKRLLVLFLTGSFLVLIALADVTPIHGFLYRHLFFFSLFRNIYYLLFFAMPFVILYAVEQLRLLLHDISPRASKRFVIFMAAAHLSFAAFLFTQGDALVSSYWVVLASFLFFVGYGLGWVKFPQAAAGIVVVLLIIVQPVEIVRSIAKNSQYLLLPLRVEKRVKPPFRFMRPKESEDLPSRRNSYDETSGLISGIHHKYGGARNSFLLNEHMDHGSLEQYVRYKFILYDRVEPLDYKLENLGRMEEAWLRMANLAFVVRDGNAEAGLQLSRPSIVPPTAQAIIGNTSQFQVLDFDLNSIRFKTNFSAMKFLVYNDSFHPDWHLTLNGAPWPLFRANLAFKGLFLPAGENVVEMRYGQAWKRWLNFFLIGFFWMVFLSLICLSILENAHEQNRTSFN